MRGKVNKSAAVRALLSTNPNMTAAVAVTKLAERGINVGANLVYAIRAELRAAGGMNGHKAPSTNGKTSVQRPAAAPVAQATNGQHPAAIPSSENVARVQGDGSVAGTVNRVIALANELGGYVRLADLVATLDAVSRK